MLATRPIPSSPSFNPRCFVSSSIVILVSHSVAAETKSCCDVSSAGEVV